LQASSEPNVTKLPSYLLPPSYPSDPQRSPTTPLALSGTFTNSHFRTLHIIYRKSLKLHAPAVGAIRPEIVALWGLKIEIDESGNGVERGVFYWKVGDGERKVLERFVQEVEFSHEFSQGGKWD
jgi:hypothetical protein